MVVSMSLDILGALSTGQRGLTDTIHLDLKRHLIRRL
jgi:hypothetical protein